MACPGVLSGPIFIILNKLDLFYSLLPRIPFGSFIPQFTGDDTNPVNVYDWIKSELERRAGDHNLIFLDGYGLDADNCRQNFLTVFEHALNGGE